MDIDAIDKSVFPAHVNPTPPLTFHVIGIPVPPHQSLSWFSIENFWVKESTSRLKGVFDSDAPGEEVSAPPQADSARMSQSKVIGAKSRFMSKGFQNKHTEKREKTPP